MHFVLEVGRGRYCGVGVRGCGGCGVCFGVEVSDPSENKRLHSLSRWEARGWGL